MTFPTPNTCTFEGKLYAITNTKGFKFPWEAQSFKDQTFSDFGITPKPVIDYFGLPKATASSTANWSGTLFGYKLDGMGGDLNLTCVGILHPEEGHSEFTHKWDMAPIAHPWGYAWFTLRHPCPISYESFELTTNERLLARYNLGYYLEGSKEEGERDEKLQKIDEEYGVPIVVTSSLESSK
jgi:hypothetical protein